MIANDSEAAPQQRREVIAGRLIVTPGVELRVLAQEFEGKWYLHIREYALTADNDYVATPRGVSVLLDKLSVVLEAIGELRQAGDKEGVVASISISGKREIRFAVTKWLGTVRGDVRIYFEKKGAGFLPTKKGIRMGLSLLAEVERALEALERAVDSQIGARGTNG